MSWGCRITLISFVVIFLTQISSADNNKKDSWLGKDKFQHFAVSAFYSGGISIVGNRHFDMTRDNSIILGASVTISLGGAKEIYDRSRPEETSSIKDFIWDIGGTLVGAVIAALAL